MGRRRDSTRCCWRGVGRRRTRRCCMSAATMRAWRGWRRRSASSRRMSRCCASRPGTACPTTASRPTRRSWRSGSATLTRLLEPGARPRVAHHHRQRAGAEGAAAGGLRRLHDGAEARRAGAAGALGRVPGGQRLQPHRHGDGAGRIRVARRHRGPVPGRRARSGAARPLRRRDRGDAPLRHRHAAERRGAGAAVAAAGGRGVPRREVRSRASGARGASCSAPRRRRTRSTSRSAPGGGIPGMEHWAGLFHERMETLLDYLPGASVSPGLPGGGRAGGAAGDDRRPLRGAPRAGPRA